MFRIFVKLVRSAGRRARITNIVPVYLHLDATEFRAAVGASSDGRQRDVDFRIRYQSGFRPLRYSPIYLLTFMFVT